MNQRKTMNHLNSELNRQREVRYLRFVLHLPDRGEDMMDHYHACGLCQSMAEMIEEEMAVMSDGEWFAAKDGDNTLAKDAGTVV